MKVKTLNPQHKEIIDEFLKEIDAFIYEITEGENFTSFQNFNPVKDAAKQLHNEVGIELMNAGARIYDWMFTLPNCLLFAALGFAAGIKNESNQELINTKSQNICGVFAETIADLDLINEKIQDEQ